MDFHKIDSDMKYTKSNALKNILVWLLYNLINILKENILLKLFTEKNNKMKMRK